MSTSASAGTSARSLQFGPLTIEYDATVLEPRAWTEMQATWGSELLAGLPPGPVLELCSGAGHIGLLTVHGHDRMLVAVDSDPAASAWTRSNADRNGIDVDVRAADMAVALGAEELFPLIVADPPWVRHSEVGTFPDDPVGAIDGGPDGLRLARRCLQVIDAHLTPRGTALLQLGSEDQVDRLDASLRLTDLVAAELRTAAGRGVVLRLVRR
ncbi:methyltransferase [Marmoricola sp. RAF53]|uniref:methyltransferase n=1 Tax=Marmoricola sp. RAF53 TaxID=3233059 RepID=UPI003F95B7FC